MSFEQPFDEELATAVAEMTVEHHESAIGVVVDTQVQLVQLRRQRVAVYLKQRWADTTVIPSRKENAEAAVLSLANSVSSFVQGIASECHLSEGEAAWLEGRVTEAVAKSVASQVSECLSEAE